MQRRDYRKLLVFWATVACVLGLFIMVNANLNTIQAKRGATTTETLRQWKVRTLEIEDGEAQRITKKIIHNEYLKPYPFEIPDSLGGRFDNFMVIEMDAMKANLPLNVSKPATSVFTTQPTQIPAPPLQPMTETKPDIDETDQNPDVSFEYDVGDIEKKFEDFEDPESV